MGGAPSGRNSYPARPRPAVTNVVGNQRTRYPAVSRGYALKKAYERAGIPYPKGRPLHVLRHSLNSNLLARGHAVQDVRDVLGHANIRTTDRYSHGKTGAQRAAIASLGTMTSSPSGSGRSVRG